MRLAALLLAIISALPAAAQSLYSWTDAKGEPHMAESLREIPAAFRARAKPVRARGVEELPRGSLEAPGPKVGGFISRGASVRLLVFTATWCGYCAQLEKSGKLEALARLVPSVELERVDLDANPDKAQRYRVRGVPTLVVVDRGGAELGQLRWTSPAEQLADDVKRLSAKAR